MLRFFAVWGGDGKAVQILFITVGHAGGRPFIAFGGEICRIFLSPKGLAICHSYTEWSAGLRISGIPAAMIAAGWMLVGQLIWLVDRKFYWPLVLMGFLIWWLADAFVEGESPGSTSEG